MVRHLLELDDLTPSEFEHIIALALDAKQNRKSSSSLQGQTIALLFEKPSTRTRVAAETAAASLGAHPVFLKGEDVGIGTRETPDDVARTLSQYCCLIGARVMNHWLLEHISEVATVPVVNLLSDIAHPTQALADVMTMRENFGSTSGAKVAFVGDGNNVAASLAFASGFEGFEFHIATPPDFQLDADLVVRATESGSIIKEYNSPAEAVSRADVVYTDVWVSMGQEYESARRQENFSQYQVTDRMMKLANPDAIFMHCLPARRGEEVAASVIDGPQSVVFSQTQNRLFAMRGVFESLLLDDPVVMVN